MPQPSRPNWLYIHENGTAPLLIGEWGGRLGQDARQDRWMTALRDLIVETGMHQTFWCINPNSGDTGGLLLDDWRTWDEQKYTLLKPTLFQFNGKFVSLDHRALAAPAAPPHSLADRYSGTGPTPPRPTLQASRRENVTDRCTLEARRLTTSCRGYDVLGPPQLRGDRRRNRHRTTFRHRGPETPLTSSRRGTPPERLGAVARSTVTTRPGAVAGVRATYGSVTRAGSASSPGDRAQHRTRHHVGRSPGRRPRILYHPCGTAWEGGQRVTVPRAHNGTLAAAHQTFGFTVTGAGAVPRTLPVAAASRSAATRRVSVRPPLWGQ